MDAWDKYLKLSVECAEDLEYPNERYKSLLVDFARRSKSSESTKGVLVHIVPSTYLETLDPVQSFNVFQRFIAYLYVTVTSLFAREERDIVRVDILIDDLRKRGTKLNLEAFLAQYATRDLGSIDASDPNTSAAATAATDNDEWPFASSCYGTIAMGGTFDHLHSGHKILLTAAAWITRRRLIVGISDTVILKNKKYAELLEPFETRLKAVQNFLALIAPHVHPYLPPLKDVFGPTSVDPDIQALVFTVESKSGGDAIAEERRKKNLPPLKEHVVDVISSERSLSEDDHIDSLRAMKLSSTTIRQWIYEKDSNSKPDCP